MTKKGPTPKKTRVRLAVIPEPAPKTRSILKLMSRPILLGAKVVLECGSCGAPLMGLASGTHQVRSLVFQCYACGAFSETIE